MSVSTTVVERKAGQAVRLDAWRAVFEKTNRILSGKPITISIAAANDIPMGMDEVPGWSDGQKITFNGVLLDLMLKERDPINAILTLKGLNYHELSHCLYTPRASEELPKRVVQRAKDDGDRKWWYAFNALEDQRIETWFTAVYWPSRRYFEAAVLQWLVQKGNTEAAILCYGRKYLPSSLRVKAGRVFMQKHGAPLYAEFQKVIDAYIGIVLPQDTVKAFTLVAKYRELLIKMQQAMPGVPLPALPIEDNGCTGHGIPGRDDAGVVRTGQVTKQEAADAAEAAAEQVAEAAAADAEQETALDEAAADVDGSAAPSADGTGTTEAGPLADDTKTATQADGDANGGAGAGTGAADHKVAEAGTLEDAMRGLIDQAHDGLDDIQQDEDIIADAEAVLDAIRAVAQDGEFDAQGPLAKGRATLTATDEHNAAVRKIVKILTAIRLDSEPEVLRRRVSGRLDIQRVLNRKPTEVDIFTQWDEGQEEQTDMEVVLLMDVSGSMGHLMYDASAAVWVLKRALDKMDIRVTAMVYDNDHHILFRPKDKVTTEIPVVCTGGGTVPISALTEAHKVLMKSSAPNKVLVTVTDGAWGGQPREYAAIMKAMDRLGVSSLLVGLGGAVQYNGKHFHHDGVDIATVTDLPKAVTKLVTQIMRRATNR